MSTPRAGFLRRFVAFLTDVLILDLAGGLLAYPLQKKFELSMDDILGPWVSGGSFSHSMILFFLCYTLLLTLLWGFYFTFFIGWNGQTPGKKWLGIQVLLEDGQVPDTKTAFTRFIGYLVSGGPFFVGFLWALFNKEKQTWHDKMARTIVIKL